LAHEGIIPMMQRRFLRWLSGTLLLAAGLLGCEPAKPSVTETPPPAVAVSQPVARDVTDYDDYEGRIAAKPTVDVRARVRGHLIKIHFEDGQIVKEGQLLFEIDPRTYKAELEGAEAQKAAAEASLKLWQATVERDARLVATGAVSRQEYDVSVGKQAVSQAEVRKADAAIDRAKLDVGFTKITAEITGKISRSQIDVGNLVNTTGAETMLTTITSVDPIYVYFNVNERALLRYRRDFNKNKDKSQDDLSLKELKIPVEVALEGEKGYPHKGLLDFAENRVDPKTGTIQVRGVLPNPGRIMDSGMRARIRVPVSEPYKALLVTDRAIGTDQTLKYVYIVDQDNVVKRRDVLLGRLEHGLRVIDNGLEPGDQVIVKGIQSVLPEMKVDPKPTEMPGVLPGT
jgi:RND family efflux transporter MFP subunit